MPLFLVFLFSDNLFINTGVFSANELDNMIKESLKMVKFNHQNVMKLIGVCIEKGPSPYIVMPYMTYGSLLSYLKKHRAELTIANNDDIELVRTRYNDLPFTHFD